MDLNIPTLETLSPHIWGRNAWEFLDMLIITYPRDNPSLEKRDALHDLFQSLTKLLPCPECKKHFTSYIQTHSLLHALSSRRKLVEFYFNLRKEIALRSNKPFRLRSPEELWQQLLMRFQIPRHKPTQIIKPIIPIRPPQPKINIVHQNSNVKKYYTSSCNCGR